MCKTATVVEDRHWVLLAGACFAVAFAVTYGLALRLEQMGVFEQYNVMFDADAEARLNCFADGWGGACRSFVHPNLANYVNPPVRVLAEVADRLGIGAASKEEVRHTLAVAISPLAAGLQSVVLLLLLRRLGSQWSAAALLSLLGAFSFSQMVFGSVPEHFALSGLALSAALLMAAGLTRQGRVKWVPWLFVGTFAAGVTITNLLLVAMAFLVGVRGTGASLGRAISASVLLSAAVLSFVVLIALPSSYIYQDGFAQAAVAEGGKEGDGKTLSGWVRTYQERDIVSKAEGFPLAVGFAVAVPNVGLVENAVASREGSRYRSQFTTANTHTLLEMLVAAGIAVGASIGGWLAWRRGGVHRTVALASAGILAFNGVLHAFWGMEYFLYSQHWNVATLALLSGLAVHGLSRAALTGLACVIAVVAINNLMQWERMLSLLG